MKTNTIERLEIEKIAEQFRLDEGFTEDANIAYISGFDTGINWQYDKLKEERDLLIEVLKIFIDNTGYLDIWCNDSGWDKINKAKELLNTIKK